MSHDTTPASPAPWPRRQRQAVTEPKDFVARGWVAPEHQQALEDCRKNLRFRVPAAFTEAIDSNCTALSRQFVPDPQELEQSPHSLEDPIGDERHSPVAGLTHRYPDRVLLKPTYHCASYCRYCFRRYKVSQSGYELQPDQWQACLSYIRSHPQIHEVILTGGDPLTLTDKKLESFLKPLADIPHIETLRIHSRILTVLPERVNPTLVQLLSQLTKPLWLVTHINSHHELTPQASQAAEKLSRSGIPLLNQAVLLRGVNDSVTALTQLSRALIRCRIQPYYLHYLDQAQGTEHFRIPLPLAQQLHSALLGQLPGYAVPRLILDLPGGDGKIPIETNWLTAMTHEQITARSPVDGACHSYDLNIH